MSSCVFCHIPSSHCDSSLLNFELAYEQCTSVLLVVISVHLVGIVHKFIFLYFRKSLPFTRWIDSLWFSGLAWAFKLLLSKYIATRIWHARACVSYILETSLWCPGKIWVAHLVKLDCSPPVMLNFSKPCKKIFETWLWSFVLISLHDCRLWSAYEHCSFQNHSIPCVGVFKFAGLIVSSCLCGLQKRTRGSCFQNTWNKLFVNKKLVIASRHHVT